MSTALDTPAGGSGCAPTRCHATANSSIELFVGLLEQAAQANGGTLSIEEIRALSESFKQAPGKLATFYEQTYADCTSKTVEQSQPSDEVRNPYRQLLMSQISAGMVRNLPINRDRKTALFAPRLLKAFVKGLERQMPRKFVKKASTRAIATEARLRKSLGEGNFTWEAYCQAQESRDLLADTLVQLCHAFDKAFGQQADLLVAEVNDLLGNVLVSKGVYMPGPPAVFGTQQFRRALKAMIEQSIGDSKAGTGNRNSTVAQLDEASRTRVKALYRKVS